jgi:3-oxoadipate enol-lactonase
LHGLSATAAINWFPAFSALSRRFHVIALDQRGHGRGIRSRKPFRLEDCADDVAALLDVLGIERAIPVGYSMGGPVAQLTWRRHRDRVVGLVLCATSRNFASPERQSMVGAAMPALSMAMRIVPPAIRQTLTRSVFSSSVDDPPVRQWLMREMSSSDPAAIIEAAQRLGQFHSNEWIGEVDVPTAVVVTLLDRLVSPQRQLKLADAIPGATVHPIEGDHGVCVSRPDLFVPALLDACQSVVRRIQVDMNTGGR